MLYYYSPRTSRSKIKAFGYELFIEYRPRLKTFDLIFYPNMNRFPGNSKFIGKFNCRHKDFTALMACIIKASEDFYRSTKYVPLYAFLKVRCAELIAIEAMAAMEIPCA